MTFNGRRQFLRQAALKPQEDNVRVTSYLTAQSAGGFLQAPVAHFQTNKFLPQLSPTIEAIAAAISDVPQRGKVIVVPLRGAISRVSPMVTQSRTIQ
jgi:hypothetical protein